VKGRAGASAVAGGLGAAAPALLVLTLAACGLSPAGAHPSGVGRPSPPGGSAVGRPTAEPLALREIARLEQPVAMAVRAGDDRLYVALKTGTVVSLERDGGSRRTVLDVHDEVSLGSEQGLLGLAFSPDGGWLYVSFTDRAGDTRIQAFRMRRGRADGASRRRILFVDQPYANHNGGQLAFGPDGYLYVGLGDGGSGGDPDGNGQSLTTLLGKILRIAPTPDERRPYRIPPDNPFVRQPGVDPEIWAYGLRNPWRFSFDAKTGELWIADVGQSAWEEIDLESAGSGGGRNYGWNRMEGGHPYAGGAPDPSLVRPVYEYPHGGSTCAVTGGYVYRGSDITALVGWYVFADFCRGTLEALREGRGGATSHEELGVAAENVSAFGQDRTGELYVLSLSGPVYRLVPAVR
jgi:glucose/arabinose dehydrogenase